MKATFKRLMIAYLCLVLLSGLTAYAEDSNQELPQLHYGDYLTLNNVYDYSDCYSMQGMCVDNTYAYCVKINGSDTNAFVTRLDKSTGDKTYMTNATTGTYFFSNLGHANALDIVAVNGKQNLFVTGGSTLIRLTISGTTLTTAGTYTATYNGATASMTAVQIMSASNTQVKVLVKSGRTLYTGTLDPTASSGNIVLSKLCTLNVSEIRMKGSVIDYSAFTQQGFDYHDGKVFLPLTGNASAETINYSIVAVYDLEGATGELKNDPSLSFRVISGNYSGLFEIEDTAICPMTGRLYFSVQRRKTASDTDYDAVSYFYGYTYNPAMSAIAPADYRWETKDNELVSVTDGGNVFNQAERFHGDINDNVMSQAIFSLSRSVVLKHDSPWVVEWKSSGSFSGGSMMLATQRTYGVTDAAYLFRYQNSSFIAFGAWDGSKHNNYGITLSDHNIDGTAEHVYRLTNKIASDGSNMVYLSVDGKELGAMNNHYINATAQNTTSDWLNGKDFTFSYIGSYGHPMNYAELSYLQIWADGVEEDIPDNYRWETQGDQLASVTDGYTENDAIIYRGTLTDNVYSSAAYRLEKEIVLMHDRPWSVEWQSDGGLTGGTFLLASSDGGNTMNAPFLFRYTDSGLIAFGYRVEGAHLNYGIMLSDHGIDGSTSHVYRLTNKIADDGSNMVYLSVDGVELGAMNNHYVGITSQGYTSDWLNGKDLVFDYIGNGAYRVNGTLGYMEVREEVQSFTVNFVDYDGTVLQTGEYGYGEMPAAPADPVRASSAARVYTFTGWSAEISPVTGDTTYTATYTSTPREYPVTFLNEDGSVLGVVQTAYGEYPQAPTTPTKAADAQYTYTFAGWSPSVVQVYQAATYTATYTATVIPAPAITPSYPTLSFEGEILYNVYYTVADMDTVSPMDMGLVRFATRDEGGTIDTAIEIVGGAVTDGTTYMVRTNGIPAKNMGDVVYFKVYARLPDGSYVYSPIMGYNAVAYANTVLSMSTSADKDKALVVAMLNYGAAAQSYFGYNTGALVNAGLTAQQQALVDPYQADMVADVVSVDSSKVGAFARTGGYSNMYASVSFDGAFAINYYFTPSEQLDGELTLYYWDIETYNSGAVLTAENAAGQKAMILSSSGEYGANVAGIAAKEIDQTILVAGVYESNGSTYCTGIIAYSLGRYCKNYTDNNASDMQDFAQATVVYGYYAKQYFSLE